MQRRQGFTLIEMVIVIVVVAAGLAGILSVYSLTLSRAHEPLIRQRALALANAHLDEILHKRWHENSPPGGGRLATDPPLSLGPESSESRASFDDLDDYHGLDTSPPQDQNGVDLTDYSGYRVQVQVIQPATDWQDIPAADVRHIRVSVTSPQQETLDVVSYRLNF